MKKIPVQNLDFYSTTTTKKHFTDPQSAAPRSPIITDHLLVEANLLIEGKLQNNLYIDSLVKSPTERIHVYAKPMDEPYFEYIEKLQADYANHFDDNTPPLEKQKHLRDALRKWDRTNYQISHCRPEDGIVSINTMRRNAIQNGVKPSDWLIDTTHQASFRTPDQIAKVGTIFKTESCRPSTEENPLTKILREIFTFGKTTYQREYCDVAERNATGERDRPIDMYTKN